MEPSREGWCDQAPGHRAACRTGGGIRRHPRHPLHALGLGLARRFAHQFPAAGLAGSAGTGGRHHRGGPRTGCGVAAAQEGAARCGHCVHGLGNDDRVCLRDHDPHTVGRAAAGRRVRAGGGPASLPIPLARGRGAGAAVGQPLQPGADVG